MRDVANPLNAEGAVRMHRVRETGLQSIVSIGRWDKDQCVLHPDGKGHIYSPGMLPMGWSPKTEFAHNDFIYEWGAILSQLLLRRGLNYGVGGMYLEFENTGSPGDPVTVPTFTRDADEGVNYYNGLYLSADRDYLRVPVISGQLSSSDTTKYPVGNRSTFFAQSSGVEGVHGKPFSAASNSTCFGGALVAFVDEADPTRDLVLSRFYLEEAKQQVKLDNSQVGYEWRVTFK